MIQIEKKVWTYEDYYQLNDGKRYEVIHGGLIEMPASPRFIHQKLIKKIGIALDLYVEKYQLGEVCFSPLDIQLDDYNTVQPDLIFIDKDRLDIIDERRIIGSPDLVVEILSPSTTHHDREVKYQLYQEFRIKEYWMVDPFEETIEVYWLNKGSYELAFKGNKIQSILLPDLTIDIQDLMHS